MSSRPIRLELSCRGARQPIVLGDHLDADLREQSAVDANTWIKGLRLARVDSLPLRDRFHYRGDSLWWFTELYLHKEARVLSWFRTLRTLERCLDAHAPDRVAILDAPAHARPIVAAVLRARGIEVTATPRSAAADFEQRLRLEAKARFLTWSAHLSRIRHRVPTRLGARHGLVVFVHSAFWRRNAAHSGVGTSAATDSEREGTEGYIGPVIEAIGRRIGDERLTLVGVGPRLNFRARSWWHGLTSTTGNMRLPFAPVEAFAPAPAIAPSLEVWRRRRRDERLLLSSGEVREAARVAGYDLWSLVAAELRGVVRLQWPWSARAMDEAGAVLDTLTPAAVATYAEAGGWGRAIVLEARRRGIPTAGLQHGFIYRHWLNYLHEPDEMAPSATQASDLGFPRPARTLLFDRFAEQHLRESGHFPPDALTVTGSPGLDALVMASRHQSRRDRQRVRRALAPDDEAIVLVAAKYTQIGGVFRAVAEAASALPGVRLVVKCHPAETPEPYQRDAAGLSRVVVANARASLAALLSVSRGLVTVNSTVAIDALVLGVPTLVVDLPSNLSPFVQQGVMLGASTSDDIGERLAALLADGGERARLLDEGAAFLSRYHIRADGRAADRACDAIVALTV